MKTIRRVVSIFLAVLILLSCTGCSQKNYSSGDLVYGNPRAKDCLRILVDLFWIESRSLHNFAFSLQESGGLENFVLETLPAAGVERKTAISRLNAEIMAGEGPDVFILLCGERQDGGRFIPYPEKVMENGMFLPLDTYMENNSRFTNWEDQHQTVLAAGRNEEGQQIIPLSYTIPVVVYQQTDLDVEKPDTLLTWNDTLTDPKWKEIYAPVNDMLQSTFVWGTDGGVFWHFGSFSNLQHVVGRIADYKEERLLVTEEELTRRIKEIFALREEYPATYKPGEEPYREEYLSEEVSSKQYSAPITILPLYSDDGGITASVTYYAAVNRNTRSPEDAFTVIDILMRESTQLQSDLFALCASNGHIPLNNNAFHPDHPFRLYYLKGASLDELNDVREQITAVNFSTDLSVDIDGLLYDCEQAYEKNEPIEEIIHETYENMLRKLGE